MGVGALVPLPSFLVLILLFFRSRRSKTPLPDSVLRCCWWELPPPSFPSDFGFPFPHSICPEDFSRATLPLRQKNPPHLPIRFKSCHIFFVTYGLNPPPLTVIASSSYPPLPNNFGVSFRREFSTGSSEPGFRPFLATLAQQLLPTPTRFPVSGNIFQPQC